jgi:hypothetical protein
MGVHAAAQDAAVVRSSHDPPIHRGIGREEPLLSGACTMAAKKKKAAKKATKKKAAKKK